MFCCLHRVKTVASSLRPGGFVEIIIFIYCEVTQVGVSSSQTSQHFAFCQLYFCSRLKRAPGLVVCPGHVQVQLVGRPLLSDSSMSVNQFTQVSRCQPIYSF